MPVPNTFANATTTIPLSNLDNNFATPITLGNTAIQLGNTVTTLNNMTFANVTISSVSTPVTVAQGGTGATTLAAENVIIGNTTGAVKTVAPGTTGNVLTSNGTVWLSQAPGAATGNVTIGNTTVALGGTATTVGNLTLTNTTISSVASTFPNSYLANSTATLGNTTITLGSTTSSVGNLTLTNTTVTNYTETPYTANSTTAITLNLSNGTVQIITLTGNATVTMPTATSGKSFILFLKQDATGSRTVTWTTVKWPSGTAPTITSTASKQDIYSFFSDGTNWYGVTVAQNYTP